MATQYHIYRGNNAGGPVDYGTIVATVAGLTWDSPALDLSSQNLFAVRAFDTVSALEESNVDAIVRVSVDGSGVNITARPNAPTGLSARATASGGARVEWQYATGGQGAAPTGFRVYAGTPAVSYASPAATVTYSTGRATFAADLTGLTGGASYEIGVRSYNAVGEETNTAVVTLVADTAGPDPVVNLSITATAIG